MNVKLSLAGASLLLLLSATACGRADGPSSESEPTSHAQVSPLSYGEIFALVTTALTVDGQPAYEFGATLTRPTAASVDACDGATVTAGSCCYLPAIKNDVNVQATGSAGKNPDGGFTYTDESAGRLTLTRDTTGEELAALDYGVMPAGFGTAQGYPTFALNPAQWNAGEVLHIRAAGEAGHLSELSASVRGVALPDVVETTSIARSTALALSWTPDANATSMTLTLTASPKGKQDSHGTIACKVDDGAGKVTVDASLLAHFEVGDTCWGYLERAAVQNVELTGGHVTVVAKGRDTFVVPVE